jgi:hypothetical protein
MVTYMQPEATGESILAFDEPLLYDVRSLTKLAPALGQPGMAALVAPFEGGQLKIWGIVTHSYAALAIKVLDPGALIVKFVATNIAAVSGAEAVHIRDPLLTRSSTIWSRFASADEKEEYSSWNDPRVDAVLEAVKIMRSLGHGGALIIVPDGGGRVGEFRQDAYHLRWRAPAHPFPSPSRGRHRTQRRERQLGRKAVLG